MRPLDLWLRISQDLAIPRLAGEDDCQFEARVAYSAAGLWLLTTSCERTAAEGKQHGNRKAQITRRTADILDRFVQTAPKTSSHLFSSRLKSATHLVNRLRRVYEETGVLVSSGVDNTLALSEKRLLPVSAELALSYGTISPERMVGLGLLTPARHTQFEAGTLLKQLLLPQRTAKDLVQELIKTARWKDWSWHRGQWFDWRRRGGLSKWNRTQMLPEDHVTIWTPDYRSFGLLCRTDQQWQLATIPPHYVADTEYRRLMAAIRALHGNPLECEIRQLDNRHSALFIRGILPFRSEAVLNMLSWPLYSQDLAIPVKRIVPNELLGAVRTVLSNLSIKMGE